MAWGGRGGGHLVRAPVSERNICAKSVLKKERGMALRMGKAGNGEGWRSTMSFDNFGENVRQDIEECYMYCG